MAERYFLLHNEICRPKHSERVRSNYHYQRVVITRKVSEDEGSNHYGTIAPFFMVHWTYFSLLVAFMLIYVIYDHDHQAKSCNNVRNWLLHFLAWPFTSAL